MKIILNDFEILEAVKNQIESRKQFTVPSLAGIRFQRKDSYGVWADSDSMRILVDARSKEGFRARIRTMKK